MKITKKDFDRIRDLKFLDIQQCSFCHRVNLLNLGWKPFGKFYCRIHDADYFLCWELCYKVCLNIWGCELYQETKEVQRKKSLVNQKNYKSNCYLCFKELKGAGKTGNIKNRNNPNFWGIESEWKVMCLGCIGRRFYKRMSSGKRKTYQKYLKRGYE